MIETQIKSKKTEITYVNNGLIAYHEALELQQEHRNSIIRSKQDGLDTSEDNVLFLSEHPPILTFGSSAKENELLVTRDRLSEIGLDTYDIRRGGAITFHGPGQIVGYPVLDLENFKTDVRWYIQNLAEVIIRTLSEYDIAGFYDSEYPGVWILDQRNKKKKKICAIGVHMSRWITNHGFALNVNNSMEYYQYFIPCNISEKDRTVTTIQNELQKPIDIEQIRKSLVRQFSIVFDTNVKNLKNS